MNYKQAITNILQVSMVSMLGIDLLLPGTPPALAQWKASDMVQEVVNSQS